MILSLRNRYAIIVGTTIITIAANCIVQFVWQIQLALTHPFLAFEYQ
jgi:hypothetical protein